MAEDRWPGAPGRMAREAFLERFGGVYEKSPWVAERLLEAGLAPEHDAAEGLGKAMRAVVDEAGEEKQLELLRAHPDLAGRLAVRGELTAASADEQASSGLDRCAPEEFEAFQDLNERYRRTFGFPFILAVRGRTRREILEVFRARTENGAAAEFAEALRQVHEIARMRIEALFGAGGGPATG